MESKEHPRMRFAQLQKDMFKKEMVFISHAFYAQTQNSNYCYNFHEAKNIENGFGVSYVFKTPAIAELSRGVAD